MEEVERILNKVIDLKKPADVNMLLGDLGVDSLIYIKIIVEIENLLNIEIPFEQLIFKNNLMVRDLQILISQYKNQYES